MEEQFVRRGDAQSGGDGSRIYNAGPLCHFLRWMRLLEQLLRYLTEIVNKTDSRVLFQRIVDATREMLIKKKLDLNNKTTKQN